MTRQEIENAVIVHLIKTAAKHGYLPRRVGGNRALEEKDVIDHVFSVDESTIYFRNVKDSAQHCAVIVLGNDGWDCIVDHSEGEGWDDVMKESSEFCEHQGIFTTPGPWTSAGCYVKTADKYLATCYGPDCVANAKLMAAALAMQELLTQMVEEYKPLQMFGTHKVYPIWYERAKPLLESLK